MEQKRARFRVKLKQDKENQLREAEDRMNRILEKLDAMEKQPEESEDLTFSEVLEAKKERDMEDGEIEEETKEFLGNNPSVTNQGELNIIKTVADRIKVWSRKGLTEKEEKQRLLAAIPRKNGEINLEAPNLNEEISVGLTSKALAKDGYYKEYQDLSGAALVSASIALSMILNHKNEPLERESLLENLGSTVRLLL